MFPRLCYVPAGKFIMGREKDPELEITQEYPPREIYIDEFYIDETPITVAQYKIFVQWIMITKDHSRCHKDEPENKDHRPFIPNTDLYLEDDQPITGIDWFDMYAFASWAGMRLVTEAEWEKAARGIDGRLWPWGNQSGLQDGKLQALYDQNFYYIEHPTLAGVYDHPDGVSPFGCFDMAGNVWEVCSDYYDINWYDRMPQKNPINNERTKMVTMRGGSWNNNEHDAMCAIRSGIMKNARLRDPIIGFRCASNIPNPCGAIGPMRHLKPKGDLGLPDKDYRTIIHSDGSPYYDGDEITIPPGLLLGNNDPANLNDFLIGYHTPPPLNWMNMFSNIDIRESLRDSDSYDLVSDIENMTSSYYSKKQKDSGQALENLIKSRYFEPLRKIAGINIKYKIITRPSPIFNGDVRFEENGIFLVGVNAGLLLIHERLGRILSHIESHRSQKDLGRDFFNKMSNMLSMLREYVRGIKNMELPSNPVIPTPHEAFFGGILSGYMTNVVLCHEIGHIALNHLICTNNSAVDRLENWEKEFAADEYSINIAVKSDHYRNSKKGFGLALGFWGGFLHNCETKNHVSDTHPSMKERLVKWKKTIPHDIIEEFDFGFESACRLKL